MACFPFVNLLFKENRMFLKAPGNNHVRRLGFPVAFRSGRNFKGYFLNGRLTNNSRVKYVPTNQSLIYYELAAF